MHKIALPQAAIDRVLKRRKSLHVFNDIDPARTAHVVVDLQNGFMAQGQPAEVPAARDIVPNVNRISAALRSAGGLVIYIQNTIDAAAKEAWSNWFTYMSGEGRREAMEAAFADGSYGHSLWPGLEVLPQRYQGEEEPLRRIRAGLVRSACRPAGAQYRHLDHHRHRHECLLRVDRARCDDDELQGDLRVRRHRHLQ